MSVGAHTHLGKVIKVVGRAGNELLASLGDWLAGILSLGTSKVRSMLRNQITELAEQALLAGLDKSELDKLTSLGRLRTYRSGEKILSQGEPASSLFFLKTGVVHAKLPNGIRLATIAAGMAFGEMALLETNRSADVYADAAVTALEVPLADFERFREDHPRAGERIMRNLAQLLADRLILANTKLSVLTAT